METIIYLFTGIVGSISTYYMSTQMKQGPVRSSALLTLVVAILFYLFPEVLSPQLSKNIPVVFIGASFIGMVSSTQLSTYMGLSLAGVIFALIYINTSRFFDGFGGALGTSACISLLVVLSVPFFKSKRGLTIGFLQLRRLVFRTKKTKKHESITL